MSDRSCTCYPGERPEPCAGRFALSECREAAAAAQAVPPLGAMVVVSGKVGAFAGLNEKIPGDWWVEFPGSGAWSYSPSDVRWIDERAGAHDILAALRETSRRLSVADAVGPYRLFVHPSMETEAAPLGTIVERLPRMLVIELGERARP